MLKGSRGLGFIEGKGCQSYGASPGLVGVMWGM